MFCVPHYLSRNVSQLEPFQSKRIQMNYARFTVYWIKVLGKLPPTPPPPE